MCIRDRDGLKIITTPTDPRTKVETTNPNNIGGPIMSRPIMSREEDGIIQGAVASTAMIMRSTRMETEEIQGADNEGTEVSKATAGITITDPK